MMQPPTLAPGISRDFLLLHRACPHHLADDGALVVACAPSAPADVVEEFGWAYRMPVRPQPVSEQEIDALIERLVSQSERRIELERAADDPLSEADVRDLVTQPPVIRYVNLLVRDAYDAGASDIHLEATATDLIARMRIDGLLVPGSDPPRRLQHAVVTRLKLLADLDIAERRRPQDGRIRVRLEDRELDLRVSTIPTVHGESVVLRLLERGGRPVGLPDLGLDPLTLERLSTLVARPHGLLVVTGPTGSGKTTTLYAALQLRDRAREKIITVEDPVEYELPGITQVPVQRQAGVSFAGALRAILRQDPDVVMIGEMRDRETAEIATQAAMTGHLVLTTLHTNDAVSAIPRLIDLGVPPYLVAATLTAVLAQRLVRCICDQCAGMVRADPAQAALLAARPVAALGVRRGRGCAECRGTGYRGRIGIFELLAIDVALQRAISAGAPSDQLATHAETGGLRSMRADGWEKVRQGRTTIEEVLRVAQG